MPGLFGVFIKKEKQPIHADYFETMTVLLNFFNYEIETIKKGKIFIGSISPRLDFNVEEIYMLNKRYLCCCYGNIYSLKDTYYHEDISFIYRYIIRCLINEKPAQLANINGDFTVLIYDEVDHILYLLSDRFSFKKIYMLETATSFIFSPDIIVFKELSFLNIKLNKRCLAEHILYTHPFNEDDTFLSPVKVLPAATITILNEGGLKKLTYWNVAQVVNDITINANLKLEDYSHTAYSTLQQAIKRRFSKCEHMALSLSGGLDSRTLIGIASAEISDRIISLSYGYKKSHECKIAKQVASELGINWLHEEISNDYVAKTQDLALLLTDGIPPALQFFHLYAINNFVNRMPMAITHHLSGFYGDVLLGGSKVASELVKPGNNLSSIVHALKKKLACNINPFYFESIFSKKFKKILVESRELYLKKLKNFVADFPFSDRPDLAIDFFFIKKHARRYLSCTSFFSFYCSDLKPFFDYDFFDFYVTIPPTYRINHKLYYHMVQTFLPRLAKIPYNKTGSAIGKNPSYFFKLKKKYYREINYYLSRITKGKLLLNEPYNYVQFAKWFHSDPMMIKRMVDLLLEDQTLERNIINRKGMLYLYDEFKQGKWVGIEIVNLFFLEKWFRFYLDN